MTRKSIWAVFGGFLLFMALGICADLLSQALFPATFGHSGANLTWFAAMAIIVHDAAFGVVGGYLTARLAGSRPMTHAAVLGGVVIVISLVGLIGSKAPVWFNLGYLAMILPSMVAGAFVRLRQANA